MGVGCPVSANWRRNLDRLGFLFEVFRMLKMDRFDLQDDRHRKKISISEGCVMVALSLGEGRGEAC